jgi:hypothetical protein
LKFWKIRTTHLIWPLRTTNIFPVLKKHLKGRKFSNIEEATIKRIFLGWVTEVGRTKS